MSGDAQPTPAGPVRAAERVVMLGLDGVSWDWIGAPEVERSMPNLRQLLATSSKGILASTVPPYTGPAWTSITTGVDPGRHGIFGFTDAAGRPISAAGVDAPRVWDYVGASGGRSIVVNVPITFPPRSIQGLLIAGMPAVAGRPFTFPDDLQDRVAKTTDGRYVVDIPILGSPRPQGTLERLSAMTEARGDVLADLARSETWDLLAAVFVLPDRLGHPWHKYLVPGTTLYDSRDGRDFRELAAPALRSLDDAIGKLIDALPPSTAVVVCSDHGFGPLRADIFFDLELIKAGLIPEPKRSVVTRVTTQLGRGPLARLVPRSVIEKRKRAMSVAGDRRARAWTAPKYEGSIRLADPKDASLRAAVRDLLLGLRDPSGERVVERVHDSEEVLSGPHLEEAAHLFPTMVSEEIELHEGVHSPTTWLSREGVAFGTHARDGIVAVSGVPVAKADGRAADITPTMLAILGLEVADLDGTSLVSGISTSKVTVDQRTLENETRPYDESEEEQILEHLKGLGYVE